MTDAEFQAAFEQHKDAVYQRRKDRTKVSRLRRGYGGQADEGTTLTMDNNSQP